MFKSNKSSLLEKLHKLKKYDDIVIETLKDDETENELGQILQRNQVRSY